MSRQRRAFLGGLGNLLPLVLLLLALGACAPAAGPDGPEDDLPDPGAPVVLWDTWGVPHVFAANDQDLFFAHGWAQATAHGDLMLRLYGQARGRGAEYWGEDYLDGDRWVWTVGIPGRAEAWLAEQDEALRSYLEAFAAGVNAYAAAHPERIADEVQPVLPVVPADLLAHTQRAIHFTFLVNPQEVAAIAGRWQPDGEATASLSSAPAATATPTPPGAPAATWLAPAPAAGSNAWAVAPARSASGHALLLANPHLPWSDLFTWFELQLTGGTGDDAIDAYGATLVGTPFLGIAWNDHLGWTHTVNTLDGYDLYELELSDDGAGYLWDGEVRPFETESHTLRVRGEDGELREETVTVRRSIHGPVVHSTEGGALALRVVGLDRSGLLDQYWRMARARSLAEMEEAVRALQMPMFTLMYADRDGHVLHLFNGLVPDRPEGPWDFSLPVPGTGPETLWTETYAYERLPRVLDPGTGWLQNANDPPWTTTFPRALDPEDFPADMAPRFMHFRAQRSARLLMEDEDLTFEELVAAKHSTRMELADRILDDLARAVSTHRDEDARDALEVLRAWDRAADAESRGAVLFERFVRRLNRSQAEPYADPWDPEKPLRTPDRLADPAGAAALLAEAAREVRAQHGSLDVPWGEVHRLRAGDRDLPANGGPGDLGIFRVVGFAPAGEGAARRAVGGDSFVAAVEFSDPVRARALLAYGNASQPGSPHAGDQLELFAAKELRPVWRTREEIEEHLERREVLDAGRR
jgi:acyl-homoserine-lactone acylase